MLNDEVVRLHAASKWVPNVVRAADVEPEPVEWIIPGLVPAKMLSVLAGPPKHGKSMLTLYWAALLSQRELVTLVFSAEDDWGATIIPRLLALEADLDYVRLVSPVELPEHAHGVETILREHTPALIVIDPLVAYLSEFYSSNSQHGVRRALEPLRVLVQEAEHRCACLWLQHLNKSKDMSPLDRLAGSGAFGALPRSVMFFAKAPEEDEDADWQHKRVLVHYACNVAREAPSESFVVESIFLPQHPAINTARLRPLGASTYTAEQILASPVTDEERSAADEAEQFLLMALAHAPRKAAEMEEEARQGWDISARTLRRARKRIGVIVYQEARRWWWRLPEEASQVSGPPKSGGRLAAQAQTAIPGSGVHMEERTPDSGTVSQSPPEQVDFLEWLATARLDEIQERLDTDPPAR